VYVPALLMLRLAKLATPSTAATLVVPPSVAPVGFAPRTIVTSPVKLETTFPRASNAVTCTAGVMTLPAGAPCGCTVNPSWAAAAAGGGANTGWGGGGSGARPAWNRASTLHPTTQASATTTAPSHGRRRSQDIEGLGRYARQIARIRSQRVTHAGQIDAQVRERRDAVHDNGLCGAAEPRVLRQAAVISDGDRHEAREARDDVTRIVHGGDLHLERLGVQVGPLRLGDDLETCRCRWGLGHVERRALDRRAPSRPRGERRGERVGRARPIYPQIRERFHAAGG